MTSATSKPRAGEHTKGPWQWYWREETVDGVKLADCGIFHEKLPGHAYSVCRAPQYAKREEWEANARRIVACVNACEGISNETLAADHFLRSLDEAIRERDALKTTQYELMAQFQDLLNAADSLIFRPSVDDSKQIDRDTLALRAILEPARALLAKHGR